MQIQLKPGVSTSEFWIVVLSGLLLTAQAALSLTAYSWAGIGVLLLGSLYTMQRGRLKSIQAKAEAAKIEAELNPAGGLAEKDERV